MLAQERERADQITHGTYSRGIFTAAKDPMTVGGLCAGEGLPVVGEPPDGRNHYTYCPIWQKEKERIAARRDMVAPPRDRPSVYPFGQEPRQEEIRDPSAEADRTVEEMIASER